MYAIDLLLHWSVLLMIKLGTCIETILWMASQCFHRIFQRPICQCIACLFRRITSCFTWMCGFFLRRRCWQCPCQCHIFYYKALDTSGTCNRMFVRFKRWFTLHDCCMWCQPGDVEEEQQIIDDPERQVIDRTAYGSQQARQVHAPQAREVIGGAVASKPAIGVVTDLMTYANDEWKTDRERSRRMLRGYESVYTQHNRKNMRIVRGDNYCAIRSTAFQIIVNHQKYLMKCLGTVEEVQETIQRLGLFRPRCQHGTDNWSFAGRLKYQSVWQKVSECLSALFELLEALKDCSILQLEDKVANALNSSDEFDVKIMEAFKILMMVECVELYRRQFTDAAPEFGMLFFSRDTSPNPQEFLKNHMNRVGNEGGLEQVEMHLLGHTLQARITVFRIGQFEQPDFVTHYTGNADDKTLPIVYTMSEDDRHYNIVC